MKQVCVLILCCFLLAACHQKKTAPIEAVNKELSDLSIYHLPSDWSTHNNETIQLKSLRGKVVVVVMIYTSCKAACPRLIADMKNVYEQLKNEPQEKLQMLLVSIDPKTDTPEHLYEFAKENKMLNSPWLFLRSSESNTREFAAALAVNYKKITPMDFSHSNIISVFNQEGELVHQQEGLAVNNASTVNKIRLLLKEAH